MTWALIGCYFRIKNYPEKVVKQAYMYFYYIALCLDSPSLEVIKAFMAPFTQSLQFSREI